MNGAQMACCWVALLLAIHLGDAAADSCPAACSSVDCIDKVHSREMIYRIPTADAKEIAKEEGGGKKKASKTKKKKKRKAKSLVATQEQLDYEASIHFIHVFKVTCNLPTARC